MSCSLSLPPSLPRSPSSFFLHSCVSSPSLLPFFRECLLFRYPLPPSTLMVLRECQTTVPDPLSPSPLCILQRTMLAEFKNELQEVGLIQGDLSKWDNCVCVCLRACVCVNLHLCTHAFTVCRIHTVCACVCAVYMCRQLVFTPACIICVRVWVGVDVCKNLNKSIVHPVSWVSLSLASAHPHTHTHACTALLLKHLLAHCANTHQRLGQQALTSPFCHISGVTTKSVVADIQPHCSFSCSQFHQRGESEQQIDSTLNLTGAIIQACVYSMHRRQDQGRLHECSCPVCVSCSRQFRQV